MSILKIISDIDKATKTIDKLWYRAVDTARRPPEDIFEVDQEMQCENQEHYLLPGRSLAVLLSRRKGKT